MNLNQINEKLVELKTTAGKIRVNKNKYLISTQVLASGGVWTLLDGISYMQRDMQTTGWMGLFLSAACFASVKKSAINWHTYQQKLYPVTKEQKELKKEKKLLLKSKN
ncbi:MAG: hypothetical protein PHN72_03015 [Bacilli bacterium]|nr:hypothetical protein [Bacilli bacterium]